MKFDLAGRIAGTVLGLVCGFGTAIQAAQAADPPLRPGAADQAVVKPGGTRGRVHLLILNQGH